MEDYFAEVAGPSDEEDKPSKSPKELTDVSDDELCDMAIDAAMIGCGDPETRREHFKRAVALIFKDLK